GGGARAGGGAVDDREAGARWGAVVGLVDASGTRRRAGAHLAEQTRRRFGRRVESPGTGAQPEDARQHRLGALRRTRADEGADVGRAIGAQAAGDRETRVGLARGETQEGDARKLPSLAIVRRPQLADLAHLEERGGELRARLDDADVVHLADHLQRARAVAARGGDPAAEPLAQPPRLADVEQPAVLAEQVVDARGRRHRRETLPRDVHDERLAVARRVLEREQLAQPDHSALRRALEEDAQD